MTSLRMSVSFTQLAELSTARYSMPLLFFTALSTGPPRESSRAPRSLLFTHERDRSRRTDRPHERAWQRSTRSLPLPTATLCRRSRSRCHENATAVAQYPNGIEQQQARDAERICIFRVKRRVGRPPTICLHGACYSASCQPRLISAR